MPADDFYWSPTDLDSDESAPAYRDFRYVDPWDLENYAYMRQHLMDDTLSSSGASSPPGDRDETPPTTSNRRSRRRFRGRSASVDRQRYAGSLYDTSTTTTATATATTSNYAVVDDIDESWRYGRRESRRGSERRISAKGSGYGYKRDFGENAYGDLDDGIHQIYIDSSKARESKIPAAKIVRRRSYSYSQGDYGYEPLSSYQIYSRLEEVRRPMSSPIYDDIRKPTPTNFGLSNYGHLKIDYSYNWNTLNNYIYN